VIDGYFTFMPARGEIERPYPAGKRIQLDVIRIFLKYGRIRLHAKDTGFRFFHSGIKGK
jgi:hypothetical protein